MRRQPREDGVVERLDEGLVREIVDHGTLLQREGPDDLHDAPNHAERFGDDLQIVFVKRKEKKSFFVSVVVFFKTVFFLCRFRLPFSIAVFDSSLIFDCRFRSPFSLPFSFFVQCVSVLGYEERKGKNVEARESNKKRRLKGGREERRVMSHRPLQESEHKRVRRN